MQDDDNDDPQWSTEDILSADIEVGGVKITQYHVDVMASTTVCVFEVLEKAWASVDCSLIDMKIEFGVNSSGMKTS